MIIKISIDTIVMLPPETQSEETITEDNNQDIPETEEEKVLCPHCLRTATNGLKCKGICVADNDY